MTISEAGNSNPGSRVSSKNAMRILLGAAIGVVFGLAVSLIASKLHVSLKSLSWSDLLAGWLGVSYLGVGIAVFAISFNRRELARNLSGEISDFAATPGEVRAARFQAATAALAGVMLLLPVLSMGSVDRSVTATNIVFWIIVMFFGLQSAANLMVWRLADEFMRLLVLKAHALTSAVGTSVLFVWAAAEHLHIARAASSWDIVTLALTFHLATGVYLQMRSFKWK